MNEEVNSLQSEALALLEQAGTEEELLQIRRDFLERKEALSRE